MVTHLLMETFVQVFYGVYPKCNLLCELSIGSVWWLDVGARILLDLF